MMPKIHGTGARTFFLERVTGRLALRHVDDTMHIEADLLSTCRPSFVAEAICMFAVVACVEAVIARGDGFLIHDVHVRRVNDLGKQQVSRDLIQNLEPVA